eukprot:scaffold846_cov252-Pinguiococcus_pyrenoidosus.AAC.21
MPPKLCIRIAPPWGTSSVGTPSQRRGKAASKKRRASQTSSRLAGGVENGWPISMHNGKSFRSKRPRQHTGNRHPGVSANTTSQDYTPRQNTEDRIQQMRLGNFLAVDKI